MRFDLQFFGGRGGGSGVSASTSGGGGFEPSASDIEDDFYVNQIYRALRRDEDALDEYGDGDPETLKTTLQNMTGDALLRIVDEYDVSLRQRRR